jgi:hypothetical protein
VEGPVSRLAVARRILRAISTLVEGVVAARGEGAFAAMVGALCVAVAGWTIGALLVAVIPTWRLAAVGALFTVA